MLNINPSIDIFLETRKNSKITVLSGGNNSGKSLVLKQLKLLLGKNAYMIGPIRFYHVSQLSSSIEDPRLLDNLEVNFQNSLQQEQNGEQNFIDLNQILIGLGNDRRKVLFEICGLLIGANFTLKPVDENNSLRPSYVDVDGQNLSLTSTGTRLLMTMIGLCLDTRFSIILIDEPEIGLSPKVQSIFANFLQDDDKRKKYFPHLTSIYLATHSNLFLDRFEIKNNFRVEKNGNDVFIRQIESFFDFHRLQFNLLGNKFESLFLPSAIVIVEGKTDHSYIQKIINIKFKESNILVNSSQGDTKATVYNLKTAFGDLQKSPMRSRIFVVHDSVTTIGLNDELKRLGILEKNIINWSKNGIEYFYPDTLLKQIYNCSDADLLAMTIVDDSVSIGETSYKKSELNDKVISLLEEEVHLPLEVREKLINPISEILY